MAWCDRKHGASSMHFLRQGSVKLGDPGLSSASVKRNGFMFFRRCRARSPHLHEALNGGAGRLSREICILL
eukprot:1159054-Pelagomonas_calceolata.AAC.16